MTLLVVTVRSISFTFTFDYCPCLDNAEIFIEYFKYTLYQTFLHLLHVSKPNSYTFHLSHRPIWSVKISGGSAEPGAAGVVPPPQTEKKISIINITMQCIFCQLLIFYRNIVIFVMNTNYICKSIIFLLKCIHLSHLLGVIMFAQPPLIKAVSSATGQDE
jgi:hypothetical protein